MLEVYPLGARFEYVVSMSTSSRQNRVRPSVTGYVPFGQVFSQRVPSSGVKHVKPSSSASAFSMSSAGPRFIPEISVVSAVVSVRTSRHTHRSDPSSWTPDGPAAGSLRGMSASSSSTASERISRQSSGIGTGVDVGVGVGVGVAFVVAEAPGVGVLSELVGFSDGDAQLASNRVNRSAVAPTAIRDFMRIPYRASKRCSRRRGRTWCDAHDSVAW
jgi:hypothetical protein